MISIFLDNYIQQSTCRRSIGFNEWKHPFRPKLLVFKSVYGSLWMAITAQYRKLICHVTIHPRCCSSVITMFRIHFTCQARLKINRKCSPSLSADPFNYIFFQQRFLGKAYGSNYRSCELFDRLSTSGRHFIQGCLQSSYSIFGQKKISWFWLVG